MKAYCSSTVCLFFSVESTSFLVCLPKGTDCPGGAVAVRVCCVSSLISQASVFPVDLWHAHFAVEGKSPSLVVVKVWMRCVEMRYCTVVPETNPLPSVFIQYEGPF
ncbi:unnamed protein product, partial [Ectocarpus sp. 12 AP-2014]